MSTHTLWTAGRRRRSSASRSGAEAAAQVLRHLPDDVIEPLTVEMARMQNIDHETARDVLEEVVDLSYARGYLAEGGASYARETLERALGPIRAAEILARLSAAIEATPFEFLRRSPPDQIWAFLRNEHPQTIAVVLANVPAPELAANVMQLAPPELQAELAERIASMEQISPEILKEIARVLKVKLDAIVTHEYATSRRRALARLDPQRRRPRRRAQRARDARDAQPRARRRGARADVRLRGHPQARRPLDPARAEGRRHEGPRARAARLQRGRQRADHGQHVLRAAPRCSARRWSSCSRSAGA